MITYVIIMIIVMIMHIITTGLLGGEGVIPVMAIHIIVVMAIYE